MYVAVRQRSHAAWVVVDERAPDRRQVEPAAVVPIGAITELVPSFPMSLETFELPDTRVLDLVGVDASGRITLALCRIGPAAGISQLCVARLLELATHLKRTQPFRELERRVELLYETSLADVVNDRLPDGEPFDERTFAARFADDAAAGRFRLTLASLRVSPELDAILDIVDDPTDELLEFEPVEMAAFEHGAWCVGQPRVRRDVLPDADVVMDPHAAAGDDAGNDGVWDENGDWDHVLDSLGEEDALPFGLDGLDRYADPFEGADEPLDEAYPAEDLADDAPPPAYEPPNVVFSIAGRRRDEDAFFERLDARSGRTVVNRVRRLLELGREPARTLPAGWIVSNEALSFQAGLLRERVSPPEPVVAEILRVDTGGRLMMDLPLLRILLADDAVSLFLRDLQTSNPLLRLALGPGDERCVVGVGDVFDSDFDVRSFCVAIRKLVLGVGLVGGHGGREAA